MIWLVKIFVKIRKNVKVFFSLFFSNIEDDLIQKAATSCVKLMQFRGWSGQAAQIWQMLIQRFPQNFEYKRQLGVTYLTIGKDESAKKLFEELIHLNGDSFAKAHLGKKFYNFFAKYFWLIHVSIWQK